MKNGLKLFFWVFATLALSWAGVLLTAHKQIGALGQFKDPADEKLHPQPVPGLAAQGRLVYQDLGCVTCHTQQVRLQDVGDHSRKLGERPGYPRDYINDQVVLFGSSRLGPDLRNVGARIPEAAYFYQLLYAPESTVGGQPIARGMPAHKFLFEVRPVAGRQPSANALPAKFAPAPGLEVVPTPRAVALVAYLQSLKDTYDYPTERSRNEPAKAEAGH
jgi:cytochrome c oxidase cbb3-type subunit 2